MSQVIKVSPSTAVTSENNNSIDENNRNDTDSERAESKLCTDVGAQKVVYAPILSVMHRSCLLCTDCVPYAPTIQK